MGHSARHSHTSPWGASCSPLSKISCTPLPCQRPCPGQSRSHPAHRCFASRSWLGNFDRGARGASFHASTSRFPTPGGVPSSATSWQSLLVSKNEPSHFSVLKLLCAWHVHTKKVETMRISKASAPVQMCWPNLEDGTGSGPGRNPRTLA